MVDFPLAGDTAERSETGREKIIGHEVRAQRFGSKGTAVRLSPQGGLSRMGAGPEPVAV